MRWQEFHQMTRVSPDDKSFTRWQEFHEMTRVSWDDKSCMRWQELHEMARVSWDDKSFMRWQEFHEMTRVSWDDKSFMALIQGFHCIKHRRHGTGSGIRLHQTQATWYWFRGSIVSNTGDMVLIQGTHCIKNMIVGSNRTNIQAMDTFIVANWIELRPGANGPIPALSKYHSNRVGGW
jgi:hypothetical protein